MPATNEISRQMNNLAAFVHGNGSFTLRPGTAHLSTIAPLSPHNWPSTETDPFHKTDLSMTSSAGIRPLFMGMGHSITENGNQVVSALCEIQPRGAPQQSAQSQRLFYWLKSAISRFNGIH